MKKITKVTNLLLCLFLIGEISAKEYKINPVALPKTVEGEWYSEKGKREYNGLLIHKDFIEFGYRAFMYQEIEKTGSSSYAFSAKDIQGNTIDCEINILSKTSIELKRGDMPLMVYTSRKAPKDSKRISIEEIPKILKKKWFTTDKKDNLEFYLKNKSLTFRNKIYQIEEIIDFKSNGNSEYRFLVKNKNEYWMFYFKNWSEDYLQVGFHGKMGDLYKANQGYPNWRIENALVYLNSKVPKELRGNWLSVEGNDSWEYGFYYDKAIFDKTIWSYKSIEQKRKLFVITLENNGREKVVYAKVNKDNTVRFGMNKRKLSVFSTNQSIVKNAYKFDDAPYKESDIFKLDSTTYSGVIKNYSKKSKQKTGNISVNNIFTGNQDSYLVKIKEDGSFSVKFPLYYPQKVYVKLPNYYAAVFVAPGKKTWQLINSGKRDDVFFGGDCAQVNSDLARLKVLTSDRNYSYYTIQKNIKEYSLSEYKKKCFEIHEKRVLKLNKIVAVKALSNKAYQIAKLELEYGLYENLLSYDMYSRDKEGKKIDSTYMTFLTPEIFNNKLATLTSSYSSFVNRLRFNGAIRKSISINRPGVVEFSEILKKKRVALDAEEEELIELHREYKKENAIALNKQKVFNKKNEYILSSYNKKFSNLYRKLSGDERKNLFSIKEFFIDSVVAFAKPLKIIFSKEEIAIQRASRKLWTKEEQDKITAFQNEEQNKRDQAFFNKHKRELNAYFQGQFRRIGSENTLKFFEGKGTWMSDLLIIQGVSGPISEQLSPLSNDAIEITLKDIKNPFVANYLKYENKKAIAQIEANKNNTGYVVNETPKTEADKVFDAIISKYKGKVVFVDFWATWCGPCRSGMKKMKPLKEELKDEDIVFVYITNQSSPETAYNNMIPTIKGEHYRVSQDEWNYLKSKFKITGIPHYTLIDKKGKVAKNKVYFASSVNSFKELFEEYLKTPKE